jgi:hypothetical protein
MNRGCGAPNHGAQDPLTSPLNPITLAAKSAALVIFPCILEDTTMMRRTIGLILTLGFLLPLIVAKAQPGTKIPSVAVLSPADATALSDPKRGLYAFQQGLRELGYVEARTSAWSTASPIGSGTGSLASPPS